MVCSSNGLFSGHGRENSVLSGTEAGKCRETSGEKIDENPGQIYCKFGEREQYQRLHSQTSSDERRIWEKISRNSFKHDRIKAS